MSKLSLLSRLSFASLALGLSLGVQAQTTPSTPATPSGSTSTGTTATGSSATAPAAADQATLDAAFKQADTNQDGKLSSAELGQIPALTGKFADLDKDKDGTVSSAEFSAGVAVK